MTPPFNSATFRDGPASSGRRPSSMGRCDGAVGESDRFRAGRNRRWQPGCIRLRHGITLSTKRQVPAIGQGTWYNEDDDRDAAVAALRRGIDLGITHIDTAEMYL